MRKRIIARADVGNNTFKYSLLLYGIPRYPAGIGASEGSWRLIWLNDENDLEIRTAFEHNVRRTHEKTPRSLV